MADKPTIRKTDIVIDTGQTVQLVYDEEGDDLEIVFEKAAATCAVELTDNIVLRFDVEQKKALSLILLSFSALSRPTEIGPQSFPLTGLEGLPRHIREAVTFIITHPPVNRFLRVSSLFASTDQRMPITFIESRYPLPVAA